MRRIIKTLIQIILIMVITFASIELVLQLAFLNLPQVIIQRMPQYPERYGILFDTPHGAREYPAQENINFEVNQYSGDLYQITCLSPKDAVEITPYQVAYTRDSHGFRNIEPWHDEVDMVIVGDSFTAAESITNPYWQNLSESMLILGLPGSGTLEQKLLLEYYGLPRQPKIVILAYFGGNDLNDNLTFYDLLEDGITFADKTHQNRNPLDYLVSFHLLLFIRDTFSQSSQATCHYPVQAQTEPSTPLAFFDSMVSILAIPTDNLQPTQAFQITQSALIEIAKQVEQAGSELILIYIPQKAEVYWDYLSDDTQQIIASGLLTSPILEITTATASDITTNRTAQRELLQQIANEYNFRFLDLTPDLINMVAEGQNPYFFADTHWNQSGHNRVHQLLSAFLAGSTLDKNPDS